MLEIAVCDDDIADLECAVNMLHKIFTSQKIAYHIEKFMSANQMLENISRIDIGILDISMEELNGIKLWRKLKEKFPDVKLVYITSYEEYCMQVINEVHAFSFLCKPLEYDKLELQILELLNQLPDAIVEKNFYKVTDSNGKGYLSIKLKLRDILYFEYIKRSRKVLIALSTRLAAFRNVPSPPMLKAMSAVKLLPSKTSSPLKSVCACILRNS